MLDNELIDIFQPLIGTDAVEIFVTLSRQARIGARLKYTTRALAKAINRSPATASRSLGILEYVGMVRLRHGGGNQASECELIDLKELARHLGAVSNQRGTSFSLPESIGSRLRIELTELRKKQAGKGLLSDGPRQPLYADESNSAESLFLPVSQRDASASPVTHQRSAGETQTGSYLLIKDTRLQNILSPTPFLSCESQELKCVPNEVEPGIDLNWARVKFTGVMRDMKNLLFDTRGSVNSNFTKGFADWLMFGFDSFAIEQVSLTGGTLQSTISAYDPAMARKGLDKYRKEWEAIARNWFECEVQVEWLETQRKSRAAKATGAVSSLWG